MLNGGGGGGGGAGMCTVVAACDSCETFQTIQYTVVQIISIYGQNEKKKQLLEFVDLKLAVAFLVVHVSSVIAPVALICPHSVVVVVVRFAELDSTKKKCFFFV